MMYNKNASFRVFGYADCASASYRNGQTNFVDLFDRKYLSMFPGGGGRKTKLRIKNPPQAERSPLQVGAWRGVFCCLFLYVWQIYETLRE